MSETIDKIILNEREAEILGLPEEAPGSILRSHVTVALATESWLAFQISELDGAFPASSTQERHQLFLNHFIASRAASRLLHTAGLSRAQMAGLETSS